MLSRQSISKLACRALLTAVHCFLCPWKLRLEALLLQSGLAKEVWCTSALSSGLAALNISALQAVLVKPVMRWYYSVRTVQQEDNFLGNKFS